MSILDRIERVVFGASAAEAVEMRLRLAEQRIAEAMEEEEEEEEEEDLLARLDEPLTDEERARRHITAG